MVRPLIFLMWCLGMAGVAAWAAAAAVRGELPMGAAWALIAMAAWWLVGRASHVDRDVDD